MNYKIFLTVLITFLIRAEIYAQCSNPPNCIQNPGIDGSAVGRGNAIGSSLPNWYVLSGTPILREGMVSSDGFQITNGDGMYTCYNFQAGRTYKVCMLAYNNTAPSGNIIVQAHDGTASQAIGSIAFYNAGLPPVSVQAVTFTANQNFNQLRIFTNTPGYSVVIDDVGIIEVPIITVNPSPINVCGSATLTAVSANPLTVTWSPSTGLSATMGTTVTARPCKTTTYTATYTSGCHLYSCNSNNTVSVTVYVQSNGSIVNNSSGRCNGPIDLQYVSNIPCPGSTFKWYGPKNPNSVLSTQPTLQMPSSTLGDQGTYLLEVTTPQGCKDSIYTSVVQNCCAVTADFNIIDCNPVRFENTTTDGSGNPILQGEWFWDFGNGTTSAVKSPSHLFMGSMGDVTKVCLTAIVSDGFSTCCDKICKEFETCDWGCLPKAAFDYRVTNPVNYDVQLIDKSVGSGTACQWEWTVNNVTLPGLTDAAPIIPGLGPGVHTVCLKVWFCTNGGPPNCFEEWCENIEIPQ